MNKLTKISLAVLAVLGFSQVQAGTTNADVSYSMTFTKQCSLPVSLAFGSFNVNPKTLAYNNATPENGTTMATSSLTMTCDASTNISFSTDDGYGSLDAVMMVNSTPTDGADMFNLMFQDKGGAWKLANTTTKWWGFTDTGGSLTVNFKITPQSTAVEIANPQAQNLRIAKDFTIKSNKSLKIEF